MPSVIFPSAIDSSPTSSDLLLWQPLMGGIRRKCFRHQRMHRNVKQLGCFASGLNVLLLFPNDS